MRRDGTVDHGASLSASGDRLHKRELRRGGHLLLGRKSCDVGGSSSKGSCGHSKHGSAKLRGFIHENVITK